MRHDHGSDSRERRNRAIHALVWTALVTVGVGCTVCAGQEVTFQAVQGTQIDALLDVLARVESNNNPDAIGDHGRALGAYQIHQVYWEEGTRFLGVNWPYRAAFNPDKAQAVVRAYLLHYGGDKTLADMARIHNGGPYGYRRRSTLSYAQRVGEILAQRLQVCQTISCPGNGTVPPSATVAGSASCGR